MEGRNRRTATGLGVKSGMNNGLEILVLDIYQIFIKCLGAGSCPLPNGFNSCATCPHHFLQIVGSWVVFHI